MCKILYLLASLSLLSGLALNCSCVRIQPLAGDVVDTPNKITGSVTTPSGDPAAGAMVRLRPGNYAALPNNNTGIDTQSRKETMTDASGTYTFEAVPSGPYTIELSDARSNGAMVRCTIPDNRAVVNAGKKTLTRVSTLRGVIPPEQLAGKEWFVQVLGLERFTAVNPGTGAFSFKDIPEGNYVVRQITMGPDATPVTIENIDIPSGTTITVPYAGWKYSKRLFFNTTLTGAYIAGNVYGFPVLIRVSSLDTAATVKLFDFSQAGANGRDLRFAKSDGTPLPFEIERWDVGLKRAEVWVKVDTIYGNDNTHSITMFYGNPDAVSTSNGTAVFNTADGFMGVWHLGEAVGSNAVDATGNRFDGIPKSGPTLDRGRIGMAKRFNGISQYITIPNTATSKINFSENGVYCISAWVSVDTTLAARQVLISKGNTQYTLEIRDTNRWAFTEFKDLVGWEIARSNWKENPFKAYTMVTSTWTLVTGVRSGGREYLYIDDGLCTDTTNQFIKSVKSRLTSFDLSIGRVEGAGVEGTCYFGGRIDEVRISNVAPDRDWIRLCFRNQNFTDELVQCQ